MFYAARYASPLGEIILACDGKHLSGAWFQGQKYFYGTLPEEPIEREGIPVLKTAKVWLKRYFAGDQPSPASLPLTPIGGSFRQSVWKILCEIPYGSVMTYGEIAKRIAAEKGLARMSAQAVGGAVGHNPISIIIPCHRVVGSNGSLTGYAGGMQRKEALLLLEGVDTKKFYLSKKRRSLSCGKS